MTVVVASAAVFAEQGPQEGWIAIDGTHIVEVGTGPAPSGAVDLGARILAPGFIDLQCNGLGTIDFATASDAEWRRARRQLAQRGVTACLPTFVSAPLGAYPGMLDLAADARDAHEPGGAALLGVHLEGPFLGAAPGAHDPDLLRVVDLAWLQQLLERHPGLVRVVTLAPEADPGLAGTRWLAAHDVVVALGHTAASYDDAIAAAEAGATVVTHLFNGMSPWHHRAPGVAGAALVDDRLTPTLIADLVHVHPAGLRIAFAASRVATVSDAVGSSGGLHERDGAATLVDGTLAGTTTLLDGALANLVAAGVPWPRAIESITSVPSRLLGLTDRGALRVGGRADLVALDSRTFAIDRVWVAGEDVSGDPH